MDLTPFYFIGSIVVLIGSLLVYHVLTSKNK